MENNLRDLISAIVESFPSKHECPLWTHLGCLKNVDGTSVVHGLQKLENGPIKAHIKAGAVDHHYKLCIHIAGCKYQGEYTVEEFIRSLKHPWNTDMVQQDGSIDEIRLLLFLQLLLIINEIFAYDNEMKSYILTEDRMMDYVNLCTAKNQEIGDAKCNMLSCESIVQAKWADFFDKLSDIKIGEAKMVTLGRFVNFCYESDVIFGG